MKGRYYDGRSAQAHEVEVVFEPGAIAVSGSVINRRETLAAVVVSERLLHSARTLTFPDGAHCQLAEGSELRQALLVAGAKAGLLERLQGDWTAAAACLVLLLGIAFAGYRYGVPCSPRIWPSACRRW